MGHLRVGDIGYSRVGHCHFGGGGVSVTQGQGNGTLSKGIAAWWWVGKQRWVRVGLAGCGTIGQPSVGESSLGATSKYMRFRDWQCQ